MTRFIAALVMTFWAGAAASATILESTVGEFSSTATNPTVISNFDGVEGSGTANQYDILRLDGLLAGAQNLTFTFTSPAGGAPSYAAGGNLYYSTTPFNYNWDGINAGAYGVFGASDTDTIVLSLGSTFSGPLFVGLYHTYGANMSYSITSDSMATVPLPAGGLFLLSGLLGFGVVRRR